MNIDKTDGFFLINTKHGIQTKKLITSIGSTFNDILANCLDKLPENWNFIVQAKYLLKKKSAEACQEIGISQTNYWQITHRAKLLLRECLHKNWIK